MQVSSLDQDCPELSSHTTLPGSVFTELEGFGSWSHANVDAWSMYNLRSLPMTCSSTEDQSQANIEVMDWATTACSHGNSSLFEYSPLLPVAQMDFEMEVEEMISSLSTVAVPRKDVLRPSDTALPTRFWLLSDEGSSSRVRCDDRDVPYA